MDWIVFAWGNANNRSDSLKIAALKKKKNLVVLYCRDHVTLAPDLTLQRILTA